MPTMPTVSTMPDISSAVITTQSLHSNTPSPLQRLAPAPVAPVVPVAPSPSPTFRSIQQILPKQTLTATSLSIDPAFRHKRTRRWKKRDS
jgi:hypothetical protein